MAGEDVLLRIGGDLSAYEAALARAAQLAGSVGQVSIVPAQALSNLTAFTTALKGADTVSKALVTSNGEVAAAVGRLGAASQASGAATAKASASVSVYEGQLRNLETTLGRLQSARVVTPESAAAIDQLKARIAELTQTGKALTTEVYEPLRTQGTRALREVGQQTEVLSRQVEANAKVQAANAKATTDYYAGEEAAAKEASQRREKEAADTARLQQQHLANLEKGRAARQASYDAEAKEIDQSRKAHEQASAADARLLQSSTESRAAKAKQDAAIFAEEKRQLDAMAKDRARAAADAERAAIAQYQQQKTLAAQMASLQALPQTAGVTAQVRETQAALDSLAQRVTQNKLPFQQLKDANAALIKSFEEGGESSRIFGNGLLGMTGRVIAVGLAFKGLTLVLDLFKSLGDVDRQLSLIAGSLDKLDDRQRVLTESSRMIFDVMKQTGRSADEAGELVLGLQRAVGSSAETLEAIYIPALALTVQKETDAAETIKILIGLYNNFGATLEGVSTQQQAYLLISDMVVTAANKSAIGIKDFVTALGFVSKPATDAQVPLEDLLAMMSLMGERSVRASTIGTGLRQVFQDLTFQAERVSAAFEVAIDRANPQPYVLLQTVMKKLGEEYATTGQLSADSMDRIKKAFPNTQELAGFNVLFQLFPELAARANEVATGFGSSQKILDEFTKSISSAAAAVTAELMQALDALLGGDIPGKFEGISRAALALAETFRLLRLAILGVRDAVKYLNELPSTWIPAGVGMPPSEVERFKRDSDEITTRLIERQKLVDAAAAQAKNQAASVYGPPSPYLGPAAPSISVGIKPTVNPADVSSGLDKLKALADNIIREKGTLNTEYSVSYRIKLAQEDIAAARKEIAEIEAKAAKGIAVDDPTRNRYKELVTNVETLTNRISTLNKEGAQQAKQGLQLTLKAPEGQTIQGVIDEALREFKDADLALPYRLQLAEGALEAAKAEQERIRAIAERVGLGEETRPALKAAASRVGTMTAEVNRLQAEQLKQVTAEIDRQTSSQLSLAAALQKTHVEWVKSEEALQGTTEFSRALKQINDEMIAAVAAAGKTFIDDAFDPVAYAAALDNIFKTGANKHDEYLKELARQDSQAMDALATSLEDATRSEGDAFLLKIKNFVDALDYQNAKAAEGLRDVAKEAEELGQKTNAFIDKLTGAEQAERQLRATAAGMNLIGVEAQVATRAILLTGRSIEELEAGDDNAKRIAASLRRAAEAAEELRRQTLSAGLAGAGLSGFTTQILATNDALDKQLGTLNSNTETLARYNNRVRDAAIAQAQWDQEVARFSGDTLGYLAARLREAEAAMAPLLESIGTGLMNVLQSAERAVSDFFFNAFLGNIQSAKEAFADFGRSILRELSNVLASAVVKDFLSLFTGKGLSGEGIVGLFGGIVGAIAGLFGGGSGVAGVGNVLGPPSPSTVQGGGASYTPGQGGSGASGSGTDSVASAIGTIGTLYTVAAKLGSMTGLYTLPALTDLAASGLTAVGTAMGILGPSAAAAAAAASAMSGGVVGLTSAVGAFGPIAAESMTAIAASGAFAEAAAASAAAAGAGGGSGAASAGAGLGAGLAAAWPVAAAMLPLLIVSGGMMADAQSHADFLHRENQKARQAYGMVSDVIEGLKGLTLENADEGMRRTFLETLGGFAQFSAIGPRDLEARRRAGTLTAEEIPGQYYPESGAPDVAKVSQEFEFAQSVVLKHAESFLASLGKLGIEATTMWSNIGRNAPMAALFKDVNLWNNILVEYANALEKLLGVVPEALGEMSTPEPIPGAQSPEVVAQQQLLAETAAQVNVVFKQLTEELGLTQQAVVHLYTEAGKLPDAWLEVGSTMTYLSDKSAAEVAALMTQLDELLAFETFVTSAGEATRAMGGMAQAAIVVAKDIVGSIESLGSVTGSGSSQLVEDITGIFLALEDNVGDSLLGTMVDISAATKDEFDKLTGFITTATRVNVDYKALTDAMGLAQQAAVYFGAGLSMLPDAWLQVGSTITSLNDKTTAEIDALLQHLTDVISFERFVTEIGKVTKALDMASQASLMGGVGGIFASIRDVLPWTDISNASQEQLTEFKDIIVAGLTKALVEEPAKMVGLLKLMDLEAFKKPGETVEQTGQRLGTAFTGLGEVLDRTRRQAEIATDRTSELARMMRELDKAQVDLVAAAGPEELLAAASAVEQLIPKVFETLVAELRRLEAEIARLDEAMGSAATQFLKFSVVIDTLDIGGLAGDMLGFIYSLDTFAGRLAALPGVIQSMLALSTRVFDDFYSGSMRTAGAPIAPSGGSPLDIEGAVYSGLQTLIPLGQVFTDILNEAASIPDPVARIQGINAFVGQVDAFYQSVVAGISTAYGRAREDSQTLYDAEKARIARIRQEAQRLYDDIQQGLQDQKIEAQKLSQEAIERARAESEERLKGLQKQRDEAQKLSQEYIEAIREGADAQREALQAQIDALEETLRVSKEWESVANRVRDTIFDLQMSQSSAITNPQQRLALAQAEFGGAQAAYAANPTTEAAERVSELGRSVIQALTEVFPRSGPQFDAASQQVLLVLQAIQDQARARVGDQAQMVMQLTAMRDALDAIASAAEAQIKEAERLTEAYLEGLDTQIEAERENTEALVKEIERQTEVYLEGIDRQIEANEAAMADYMGGLEQQEADLDQKMKEWMEHLSMAEQRDIQAVRTGLQPLMQKAADEMEKAVKAADLQKIATEQMRDAITGGTPTDIFIAGKMADMVHYQASLPGQIERVLYMQSGQYLSKLLDHLGIAYQEGTPSVPHTTLAQVHKGEMIITAGDSDLLRRYGIKVEGGGGGHTVAQNNVFNVSGVRDPEALVTLLADRVVEKLRGSLGADIIQRGNGRRW